MSDEPEDSSAEPRPRKPRSGVPGLAALAILIAVLALALAGWSTWRLQQALRADTAAHAHTATTLASMQHQLAAGNEQTQASTHRLGGLEASVDDQRATTQGLSRRLANLETAYAALSGQQQSGRDTLLLNDAEMLLRTAQQRYELFHDGAGALKAYGQALDVLAQVQNPAYAPLRASVETERNALAAAAPPSRQAALDELSELRSKVTTLPLAATRTTPHPAAPESPGIWSRVEHAFGGIVKVTRDDRRVPIDGRFARQALSLDLAQAQESLLAFDDGACRTALQHADATLAAQFNPVDAAVKDARAQIAGLLARQASAPAPTLGGALAQLQALRASQPAAAGSTAPPAASTTKGTQP